MTFEELTAKLEAEFGPLTEAKAMAEGAQRLKVASGGFAENPEDAPGALCLSKELALQILHASILSTLRDYLGEAKRPAAWALEKVHLDTWRITVQDFMNTQRLVADRYSAVATILVLENK